MDIMGTLYICPTPIGNLEDITLRVIRIFQEVDLIAAEDTRHTIKILNHLKIEKPLLSYHEHNKFKVEQTLISKLKNGKNIALVSDAGMPGISDPGEELIKRCIEENIETYCLPGPSALINAVVLSGLSTRRFSFEGFLGKSKKERVSRLEKIKYDDRTLIFYEAPHRLKNTLKDIYAVFGDRKCSAARELTKKFEEYNRMNLSDMIEYYKENNPRGEFVLVVEGALNEEKNEIEFTVSIKDQLNELIREGMEKKDAITYIAKLRKIPKKNVYKESFDND
ncbi:16S rRNA (cytidine(1402)-2'-O)-methyltransferase [Helicovermis profundi]|uniref:Ribosomal RNA small subunit methyltransferase I n=2 Tax=Helicovermis profundi TaxID=3065157 RepID=A0AAU9ERL2_9FIRM|nr:16S rRNA (cytidine(1402)-2'-O)-methyltransferase [Clostridia bacterium S502]